MKTYGGQAVLEGVMMRGQRSMAVACRAPTGEIITHFEELVSPIYRSRIAKMPFIRGAVMIWDTLALGMRALMFAANIAAMEPPSAEGANTETPKDAMPATVLWTTMAIALVGAIGLFFVLPVLAMGFLDQFINQYPNSSLISNLVEKILRLSLILGYMTLIGQIPDIRRVFMYHGAEHKTINAYEAGAPLTPESVQKFPIEHPRCGTTFLLIVVIVSFVVFSLLGQPAMEWRIISRIVLVPVIAGIAYEFIRWAGARYHTNAFVRFIMTPGLAVQKITTREPAFDQLAVAIAALQPVMAFEEPQTTATDQAPQPIPAAVN